MASKVRKRRIRRAFDRHQDSGESQAPADRGIGRLPKRGKRQIKSVTPSKKPSPPLDHTKQSTKPNPIHPIKTRLEQHGNLILKTLQRYDGYLPLGDHSPPEAIRDLFPFSKRVFKQTIGHLWKQRKIDILPNDGIRLRLKPGSPDPSRKAASKSPAEGKPRRKTQKNQ
jgi:hypothetical protein